MYRFPGDDTEATMAASRSKRHKKTKRAPRRQQRSEVTRQGILFAALREFARFGLAGARVDTIAERAGVNKQLLYYHFGNKEDLFRATLAFIYARPFPDEMLSNARAPGPAPGKMRELISALFKHFRSMEDGTAVIAHENQYHGEHLNAPLRKAIRTSVSPVFEAIREVLFQGQRDGVFSQEISVDHLYLTFVAMSMFYFTHAYTLSAILETDLLDDRAVDAWQKAVERVLLAAVDVRQTTPEEEKPLSAPDKQSAKRIRRIRNSIGLTGA
jgi:TetR/AcrR family transcriptional regulator